MSMLVRTIHNRGDASNEYVVLDVNADCNIQYWLLCDTTYASSTHISNRLRHMFWFPDQEAKAGDIVVLHTKVGLNVSHQMASGAYRHDVFWDLNTPVWNDDRDAAVLFSIENWKTTTVR